MVDLVESTAKLPIGRLAFESAQRLLAQSPLVRNEWVVRTRAEHPRRAAELMRAVREITGSWWGLWHDDPVGFTEIALRETLWSRQREVMRAVAEHERVVVPSCHAAGKTFLASRLLAWMIATSAPGEALGITTATRWRQVRNLLWMSPSGIKSLHSRAHLPGTCLQTEWQIDDKVVAYGFSPSDTDETAFSGIHGLKLLVIVDEAGGLSPVLGQSLESLLSAGFVRLLVIGNPPVDENGSAWMEERTKSPSYHVIRIDAESTPNFTGEQTPLCKLHPDSPPHTIAQHLITKQWAEAVARDEGVDSPYYVARVQAQFPKDVTSKTIPRSWLDESQQNDSPDPLRWVRLGVDVAADGGDRFSIARAEGNVVRIVHSKRPTAGVTTFDLAGIVLEQIELAERRRRELDAVAAANGDDSPSPPVRVKIDSIGVGMGVADTLSAWGDEGLHDAEIVHVEVGRRCEDDAEAERYANQRAQMWWLGRILSQPDEATGTPTWRLDVDDSVLVQLNAPTYGRNSSGRITIESKESMRKRGVASPDDAESVLLSVFEPGTYGSASIESAAGVSVPSVWNR